MSGYWRPCCGSWGDHAKTCPAARPAADVTREPTGGQELREAARISPDRALVAIQQGPNDWRVSNGGHYRDSHVADWTPLVPLPEVAALIADGELPLPTAPDGGTYAHHCRDATCSAAHTWVLTREGDAVTSWACDRHLAAACRDLQRENGRETRIYVDRLRRALDGEDR